MSSPKSIASIGLLAGFIQVAAIGLLLAPDVSVAHGGGDDSHVNLVQLRQGIKRAQDERDRLEAERLAEIEREASEVLARIARANDLEPTEPVVIPIPEAIEPEQFARVEPLAPVNDLVATNDLLISEQISSTFYTDESKPVQKKPKYIHDDNDTIALLLILAELD